VRNHLSKVPPSVDQENNPLLVQYIDLMLENVQTDWKQFGAALAKPAVASPQAALPQQTQVLAPLKVILDAIELNPDQAGLQRLQQYASGHPEVDIMCHLDSVSPATQGFIRGSLEAAKLHASPSQVPEASGAESPAANKPSDVVKTYTSRLQALQNKYGFKSDETPALPASTLATSATLSAAASAPIGAEVAEVAQPISTVTDAYQGRLRQLQQQYGIGKADEEPAKGASTNLDSLRARMQAIESNGATPAKENVSAPEEAKSPQAKSASQASSIEQLKARLNKVKSADS
jgi:hypothetical protein